MTNQPLHTPGLAHVKAQCSSGSKPRDEYQQLEYQLKNPHLFTTLTQCVGPRGEITTFDDVTKLLRETLEKLSIVHRKKHKGDHPVYCMRPIIGALEDPVCAAIEHCHDELDKVRATFVRNYQYMHDRLNAAEVRRREDFQANTEPKSKLAPKDKP